MLNFLNIRGTGVDFQKLKIIFSKIEPPPQGEGRVKFTEHIFTLSYLLFTNQSLF